jgi:hypothetical protein
MGVDASFVAGAVFYILQAITYPPVSEGVKMRAYAASMGVYTAAVAFWLIVGRV